VHIFSISNTNNSAFAIPPEHVFIGFRNYVIDTTAIFGMFFWKLFPSFSLPTQLPYIGLAMMNNIIPRIGSSVEQEFNKLTVSLVGPHHPRSSTHDACKPNTSWAVFSSPNFLQNFHHIESLNIPKDACMEYEI